MADLARIKNNVAKMVAQNAPESDIDGYIASEGVTIEDVRNYKPEKDYTLGRLGTIDRGATFGLGRKLGGLANAIGAYPVDRVAQGLGVENTPGFWDRYHEIVDPTMEAIEEYHKDKPIEALSLELGSSVVNPANKLGVGYIKNGTSLANTAMRSGAVGSAIGGIAGGLNTEKIEELPENILAGTGIGAAFGTAMPFVANKAGNIYNAIKAITLPEASVAGKASGLGNVIKDNGSVRSLTRGIMADDGVAAQVLKESPTLKGALNEELENALDKSVGRKLNIERSLDNQQERIDNFIGRNADYELLDFSPTEKELKLMNPRSTFNPKRDITKEEAEKTLRNKFSNIDLEVYNDELSNLGNPELGINHFLGKGKDPLVRTVEATYRNPDIKFTNDGKDYFVRKYRNSDAGNTFEDLFLVKDGKAFNKIPSDENHIAKKIKDAQDLSLASTSNAKTPTNGSLDNNNITLNNVVVNKNLPRLSDFTQGLNDFQKDALNKAINEGVYHSTYGKGTLGATHKAQEVLNDMIEASYDKSVIGKKEATTQTRDLMKLKGRLNQILEPSGVKPFDESYSKAKSLKYFREMGYNFKPSEVKFENLGLKTLRDKKAFLQGRMQKILDNVKDDKNLAKAIRDDENTLRKLMPKKRFDELIDTTSRIDREYKRLNKLENIASRELDKPMAIDRPMSEKAETLKSYLGSRLDKFNAALWANANRRRGLALLNGGATNPRWVDFIETYSRRYNPNYITPYVSESMAQNQ